MMHVVLAALALCLVSVNTQQPPGVPPRQQHQPPQGQQQQQPNQGHHQQGHHGGGHGHGGKPLEFASEVHNADHILEHLEKVVSTKSKEEMTEEELEFHYFKLHDYDNNNKLDGVEIGKALTHFHDDPNRSGDAHHRSYNDEEIAEIIDAALETDDLDGDGYVEYPEFMAAQMRMRHGDLTKDAMPPGHVASEPQPPGHESQQYDGKPPGM